VGVRLELEPDAIARCIDTAGVGFMFAPQHHAAMKHVGPVRTELGTRTIFNVLGPLSNPAGTKRQLIGVYDRALCEPLAHVLQNLGATHAMVVHGEDGLDEMTTTGITYVSELADGVVRNYEVVPEDAGLARAAAADLVGGDASVNAAALSALLDGKKGAYRDIVVLNAAAALKVAGHADTLQAGARQAEAAIDGGKARAALDALVTASNQS
jgi:anthranilate phosphoribosyltransferase